MNFFGVKPLNISKEYSKNDVMESIYYNKNNVYKKFYNRFIMGNEKSKLFFEVVADKILQL